MKPLNTETSDRTPSPGATGIERESRRLPPKRVLLFALLAEVGVTLVEWLFLYPSLGGLWPGIWPGAVFLSVIGIWFLRSRTTHIQAEEYIHVRAEAERLVIDVPGDPPPAGMIFILLGFGIAFSIGFTTLWAGMFFFGLAALWTWMTSRTHSLIITDTQLLVKGKRIDLNAIKHFELGNAARGIHIPGAPGSVVVGSGTAVATYAVASAMTSAVAGMTNVSIQAGAKAGYYVAADCGRRKICLANALREYRAQALFAALTANGVTPPDRA